MLLREYSHVRRWSEASRFHVDGRSVIGCTAVPTTHSPEGSLPSRSLMFFVPATNVVNQKIFSHRASGRPPPIVMDSVTGSRPSFNGLGIYMVNLTDLVQCASVRTKAIVMESSDDVSC